MLMHMHTHMLMRMLIHMHMQATDQSVQATRDFERALFLMPGHAPLLITIAELYAARCSPLPSPLAYMCTHAADTLY